MAPDLSRYVVESFDGSLVVWCSNCDVEKGQWEYPYANELLHSIMLDAEKHEREFHSEAPSEKEGSDVR